MGGEERSEALSRFGDLVREHAHSVLGLALPLVGDTSAAHDVSQEVFLAVWRVFGRKGQDMNWSAYLYRATIRESLRFARRGRQSSDDGLDSVADARFSAPDEEASLKEMQQDLRKCLSRLPEKQASAFVLAKIQGMSYRKCGAALGCSEQSARVHAHRAMKRLAGMLGEYAPNTHTQQSPR